MLIVLVCAFPVTFFFSFLRARMENVSWAVAATLFGVLWIGLPMAHAVFLRDLPHGDGLLIDVLVGTFIGDTAAYFGGRRFGRTPLAPDISPNKTVEGLVGRRSSAARWRSGSPASTRTGCRAPTRS